jgi:hypothetical protein
VLLLELASLLPLLPALLPLVQEWLLLLLVLLLHRQHSR